MRGRLAKAMRRQLGSRGKGSGIRRAAYPAHTKSMGEGMGGHLASCARGRCRHLRSVERLRPHPQRPPQIRLLQPEATKGVLQFLGRSARSTG